MESETYSLRFPSDRTQRCEVERGRSASSTVLRTRVAAQLVHVSIATPPPTTWGEFGKSETVRRLNVEPEQLLGQLKETFPVADLIEAGAAVRDEHGAIKLSPAIDTKGSVLVLHDEE